MLHLSRTMIMLVTLVFSSHAFGWWMWTPGDHVEDSTQNSFTQGYHPESQQPIKFSHKIHAGERQIPCQFCHSSARRSTAAGIPSVNTCMGCHKFVNTDAEPIKLIKEMFDKNEPIKWIKVHDLPDYVRFSHKAHMQAKDGDGNLLLGESPDEVCMNCHGPVKEMVTAEHWAPLQMGWCIECHNRIKKPASKSHPAKTYAPVTCNTCHY